MVGTTRARVNFFMNKFKKLGFIDYNGGYHGGLTINPALLTVVVHDACSEPFAAPARIVTLSRSCRRRSSIVDGVIQN
jgi:CRP/FNR family cyclic AMP-dependent transcriptional regulator